MKGERESSGEVFCLLSKYMRPSLPLSLLSAVWLRSKEGLAAALLRVALICLDVDEHYQTLAKICYVHACSHPHRSLP